MGAQAGKDLLIRASDGAGGYVAVAGLRVRQFSLNAEAVDVTNADSAGRWRELLAGAGVIRTKEYAYGRILAPNTNHTSI